MLRKALLVVLSLLGAAYLAYWELAPVGDRTTLVETDRFLFTVNGPWPDGLRKQRRPPPPMWGKPWVIELIDGAIFIEWHSVADGGGPVVMPSAEVRAEREGLILAGPISPTMIAPVSRVAGFLWFDTSYLDRIYNRGMRCRMLEIPHWFVVVALLAYPAMACARGPVRRMCRRARGLCSACGYDLTGNESGVCPECATEARTP